ncbi:AbiTii domain-containing protein [Candidatus Nitrospira salsa]
MSSLVLELQQSALDKNQRVTDLLRKALVVATKLKLTDFRKWCEDEMNGNFTEEAPPYRIVKGELKAWNPHNGWMPVIMEDSKSQETLSKRVIGQSIGELEDISFDAKDGVLQVPLPHDVLITFFGQSESFRLGMVPTLLVGKNQLIGMVESVRNRILNWSLEVEGQGILGEGLTFSREEVKRASNITFNIDNFAGVIGNVSNAELQIGDYNSLHSDLKRYGVPQSERNELEEILDNLPSASETERKTLLKKGTEWVMRNANSIGTLSETLRKWFE